jgi:Tol biopolymer transport system component
VSNDGKIGRLAVMDVDGGSARIVAPDIGYHYMGSFSHDGQRIAFSHTQDAYRAKIMNLEGELLVTLTPDLPESFMPRFVAGDQALIFFRRDGDVYRVAADGSDLRRLTHGNVYYQFKLTPDDRHGSSDGPDPSADGRRIAYVAVRDGIPQVNVMGVDGSGQRQLTRLPGDCGRVKWSPDGERLAFVSFVGPARPRLFVIPAEGGEPRRLTDLPGAVYTLDWFPGREFRPT